MSARNRELLGLIPASLLVTAGFAGVFIQRSNALSNVSLTYGALFLGLCIAAHIFIRFTLPRADPYMFPPVAVGFGGGVPPPTPPPPPPPAGAVVRARADPVRGHDHPVPRLPQARAL